MEIGKEWRSYLAKSWLETNTRMRASLKVAQSSLVVGEVLAMRRILILASFALVLPAFASGQHRGGGTVMHQPVVVAPPRAAVPMQPPTQVNPPAPRMGTTVVARRSRVITTPIQHSGTFVNVPTFPIDFVDSPGLGFDFAHLAAINSGRARVRFHGRFPASFGGFSGFL